MTASYPKASYTLSRYGSSLAHTNCWVEPPSRCWPHKCAPLSSSICELQLPSARLVNDLCLWRARYCACTAEWPTLGISAKDPFSARKRSASSLLQCAGSLKDSSPSNHKYPSPPSPADSDKCTNRAARRPWAKRTITLVPVRNNC
eukprot:1437816-Prymnesium_polylepis.2